MSKDAKKRSDSVNDFGRKLGKFVSAANTITAQAGKVNEDGFNELVTEEELEKFRKDQYWRVRLAMRTNNDLTRHKVMTDIEFNDIEKGKIYRDVVRDTGSGKKHAREFYRVNNDLYVKDYLGANGTNMGLSVTKKVCSNCFPPKSAVQRAAKTASMLATKNRVKPHKVN